MYKPRLFIIRGLPGSGKTTLADLLVESISNSNLPAIKVEADQFFVSNNGHTESYNFDRRFLGAAHDECYGRTMRYLKDGYNVAVANTFSTNREIDRYISGVQRCGLNVEINVTKCIGRFKSVHDVPARAIEKMALRWEDVADEKVYQP